MNINALLLGALICLLPCTRATENENAVAVAVPSVHSEDAGQQADKPPLDQEDIPDESITKGKKKEILADVDDKKAKITFYHGFFASLSVIVVSEIGDKTWFIAMIMAMRHSRTTVYAGAMSALTIMHVLSACLGWVTQVIPRVVTYWGSTLLFALFGLKMLHEGYYMSPAESQETFEEAQSEVQKREMDSETSKFRDAEEGASSESKNSAYRIFAFVSKIFLEAFMLTFVAEWGDRSQLTTIILGARESLAGTIIGGLLGHALCTGIAVVGGKLVATRISVKTVTLIGGVVFLIFACSALFIHDAEVAEPENIQF